MRFHLTAVSAFASISVVDAFAFPKAKTRSGSSPSHLTIRTGVSSSLVGMAAKNDGSQYISIEENLFNVNKNDSNKNKEKKSINNVDNGAENPSTPAKKPRKLNARTEKLRVQLEADLTIAEESRARTAQRLADAESSRLALESEAAKAAKEAQVLEEKFKVFKAKEAARAAAGGGGLGAAQIVGEIAGPLVGGFAAFGGLAAARDQLTARSQKFEEEERLQREEEQRAEQATKKKAAQQAQTKKFLPVVGAGVAGLGAFGAFFGSGSSGGGDDAVVDAMTKNTLRDVVPKQQTKVNQPNNAGSETTAVPGPSKLVDLPYLDKAIAKAENEQKEIPRKRLSKRQLGRQTSEEQRAAEARLEKKLAKAPEIARKTAEAEAKAAEETRIETEKKTLREKEASERKAAEDKAIEDKKVFEEKKAAEKKTAEDADAAEKTRIEKKAAAEATAAAEKANAERIAAEKKAADDAAAVAEKAKAKKLAADKLAFEKLKAEEQKRAAEDKAEADKIAADKLTFEKMKAEEQKRAAEEKAKAEKIAADKLAFENLKAEQDAIVEQKARADEAARALDLLKQQNSLGFIPKIPAVSEILFGNKKPSQITDKGLSNVFSRNNVMIGGVALAGAAVAVAIVAANESPSVSSTFKVTGKTPKEFLESEDKGATEASAPKKTIRIPQPGQKPSQGSLDSSETSPLPGSKEALRVELAEQRANINRQAAEKSSRKSPVDETSRSSADLDATPPFAKNSFSPFRGNKPQSPVNDSLYSTPATNDSVNDSIDNVSRISAEQPSALSVESIDFNQDPKEEISPTKPKKSFSPFGRGKPKAFGDDSLYSPPTPPSNESRDTPLVQSTGRNPDQDLVERNLSTTMPETSSSPFGAEKVKSDVNNSLYSPPVSNFATTESSTSESLGKPFDIPLKKNVKEGTEISKRSYSPFGVKPKAVANDSLYSPPASQGAPELKFFSSKKGREGPIALTKENTFSSFEESYPETTSSDQSDSSIEASLYSSNSSTETKKNYSPFGSAKPTAVIDKPLYHPPNLQSSEGSTSYNIRNSGSKTTSTEAATINPENSAFSAPFAGKPTTDQVVMNTEEEESLPFLANHLDEISSTTAPETTSFQGPSKKSFSPFGSKPKAPSDTNGNNGYLDGL